LRSKTSLVSGYLRAQTPVGEIQLEVKDPSGAPVAAAGRLENLATGELRRFHTDTRRSATLSELPAGRYRMEVSKAGFATQTARVEVRPGTRAPLTLTLPLAAQAARIDVVAATPLPGTDLPLDQVPAPVQTVTARDLQQTGALDLSDLLNQRLSGVHVNQNQENPYQPDLNYRSYTASPLLGTPEGLSVYMDGVRQNQPFGDIVAGDLIPKIAISDVALIPGSNPLFGLNTLGGAISIETKDGHSAPGSSLSFNGGSFGRRAAEFEHGGSGSNGLSWYLAGNLFREDGWRSHRRRFDKPSARSVGSATEPQSTSASPMPTTGSPAMASRTPVSWHSTTPAYTASPTSPGIARPPSTSASSVTSPRP
jgi:outer membrane receptor protein involved in Fe transport